MKQSFFYKWEQFTMNIILLEIFIHSLIYIDTSSFEVLFLNFLYQGIHSYCPQTWWQYVSFSTYLHTFYWFIRNEMIPCILNILVQHMFHKFIDFAFAIFISTAIGKLCFRFLQIIFTPSKRKVWGTSFVFLRFIAGSLAKCLPV